MPATKEPYVLPTIDEYDRIWTLPSEQLCPDCGQPDEHCNDCKKLTADEARKLGAREPVPD